MGAPNILAAIGAALQQGVGTYGRLNELERERMLQERERQDRLEQQRIAQMNADRQFGLQRQEFEAAEGERKRKRILDAIEGLSPNQRVSPEMFAQAKQAELQDRFSVTPGVPTLNVQDGIPVDPTSTTPATTEGQDTIIRRPTLKEQGELTEQANAAADRARIEKFRSHLATPEHLKEIFDQQQQEALAAGAGSIPLSGAEFERRQGIEHRNRMGEIALQNQRPYASQVGTPNMDALVQAVMANPAMYFDPKMPAKLKERLSGPLAEAGFNFRQPPASPSEYNKERQVRVLEDVADLKNHVGAMTTGFGGAVLSHVPATQARSFAAKLNTLKSNIMMNELVEMRAASKTGGALGQVSDKEGELLSNALAALDQAQSGSDVYDALSKIEGSVARWEAAKEQELKAYSPVDSTNRPLTVVNPQGSAAPKRIGRFEIVQ